jgi:lipoprotein-releasing system permease protein
VLVRWSEVLLIGGVALMITFAATLYPSWMVARRSPLEGIRQE